MQDVHINDCVHSRINRIQINVGSVLKYSSKRKKKNGKIISVTHLFNRIESENAELLGNHHLRWLIIVTHVRLKHSYSNIKGRQVTECVCQVLEILFDVNGCAGNYQTNISAVIKYVNLEMQSIFMISHTNRKQSNIESILL